MQQIVQYFTQLATVLKPIIIEIAKNVAPIIITTVLVGYGIKNVERFLSGEEEEEGISPSSDENEEIEDEDFFYQPEEEIEDQDEFYYQPEEESSELDYIYIPPEDNDIKDDGDTVEEEEEQEIDITSIDQDHRRDLSEAIRQHMDEGDDYVSALSEALQELEA